MNEWKKLDKGNLPPDILTWEPGVTHDVQTVRVDGGWKDSRWSDVLELLECLYGGVEYRYRKRQPKPPSHKDRITKFWKIESIATDIWVKVIKFEPSNFYQYKFPATNRS